MLPEYEYECETDSDKVEEFLPFFLLEGSRYSRLCQGSFNKQAGTYFLVVLRDTRMRQVNFQTFNVTKSSVHVSCRHVCDAIKNNVAEHLIKWQLSCLGNERI